MEFKELYKEWLEKNGGLGLAVNASYAALKSPGANSPIITEMPPRSFFKPGSLYVFDYVDTELINKMRFGVDSPPFYDGHPYIMALDHDKQYQYGLNLNVLPMEARVILFTALYKQYWNEICFNTGLEPIKWREFRRLNRETVFKLLRMKSKMAINKYDLRMLRNVKVIRWESAVPASTLYMKQNMLYDKKKNLNLQTLWRLVF